jgi:hypothetical protein
VALNFEFHYKFLNNYGIEDTILLWMFLTFYRTFRRPYCKFMNSPEKPIRLYPAKKLWSLKLPWVLHSTGMWDHSRLCGIFDTPSDCSDWIKSENWWKLKARIRMHADHQAYWSQWQPKMGNSATTIVRRKAQCPPTELQYESQRLTNEVCTAAHGPHAVGKGCWTKQKKKNGRHGCHTIF